MPFGLRNAAQIFQRFIDTVLRGLDFTYRYLDDILIASASEEEHVEHLRQVLERLASYGLAVNPAKCVFGQPEVDYVGYTISSHGTTPPPARVQAIADYKKPQSIAELRRFLGVMNFYRRFVKSAAQLQAPLNDFLKDSKKNDKRPVPWTPETERAFE